MKRLNHRLLPILLPLVALICSCNKLVEIPASKNQIENNMVFADSTIAASALLGGYLALSTVHNQMKYLSLYTDEYAYTSTNNTLLQFFQGDVSIENTNNRTLWGNLYAVIYQSNSLIEGVKNSTALSGVAKRRLTAEAKFLRAFAYFYLVNIYDRVPLLLSTDVTSNRIAAQAFPSDVYLQITQDLLEAKSDLGPMYEGTGKVRANSHCAEALLARIYLYQGKWTQAEQESTALISSGLFSPLPAVEEVFRADSKETIFQLWVANGFLADASQLIPASGTSVPTYTLIDRLYTSFGTSDARKNKWIGSNTVTTAGVPKSYYFPSKYKNRIANTARPEYIMTLRLSEIYLIRAEALAQQDHTEEAVNDLNKLRLRAGLLPLSNTLSKDDILTAVFAERAQELFGEWGHRFMDLKRTGKLITTLSPLKPDFNIKGGTAFPIPNTERLYNSNLIQNEGY